MSRQTEKMFKEFDRFMQENGNIEISGEDELNQALKTFMSQYQPNNDDVETAYDYLELAESATTKKEALKYAKKAAELEPDNLDAAAMVIELSCTSSEKLSEKYKNLIDETEDKLKEQGYFEDDNIGEFWLIFEQSALELYEKYPEESTQFLLPLSILYYKLGDLRKSNQYLKKLIEVNEDTRKFFNSLIDGSLMESAGDMTPYGYRPFTIEEFVIECEENYFLFSSMPEYFVWAKKKVNSKRKK